MIELLLQAERALGTGAFDVAERLYWQAIDADSQNAIAIVGLAKVARLKGDDRTAIAFGRRALKVDSENAVARKLVAELEAEHPEGRSAVATEPPPTPATEPPPAAAAATTEPPPAAAAEPPPANPAAAEASTPPSDLPADPGVRPPRDARPNMDWPAADLQQVRPPRDK
jgi:hypothetical protein